MDYLDAKIAIALCILHFAFCIVYRSKGAINRNLADHWR